VSKRERERETDSIFGFKHVRCSTIVAPRLRTWPTDVSGVVHELLHTAVVATRLAGTYAAEVT
jgi:hypothetical protein